MRINQDCNTQKLNVIYVKFDDDKAGKNLIQKSNNEYAKKHGFVPIKQILARFNLKPEIPSSQEVRRVQFLITLVWACTAHKVQGLTLDKIVVSFSLKGQKYFNCRQIYVALSRCKSLEGLDILGKIERSHVRVNSKVHEEYERLRKRNCLKMPATVRKDKKETFVISLLNMRSHVKQHRFKV